MKKPEKDQPKVSSSKKTTLPSSFLYGGVAFIISIFLATWFIHDRWSESKDTPTVSDENCKEVSGEKPSIEPLQNKDTKPTQDKDKTSINEDSTLETLDKRIDRLEGLVSEAGSFEEEIDSLKSSLKKINNHVEDLDKKINKIDTSAVDHKLVKLETEIKQNVLTFDKKLSAVQKSQKEQDHKSAIVILIVKSFDLSKQSLYAGVSWYKPLETLLNRSDSLPETTSLALKNLLEKLELYKNKQISSPASLRREFLKALPGLKEEISKSSQEKSGSTSYWGHIKTTLANFISIKRKNTKTSKKEPLFWEKMQDSLNQNNVSAALTILRIADKTPKALKQWIENAEDWIAVNTLITAGEETLLQTLLKQKD